MSDAVVRFTGTDAGLTAQFRKVAQQLGQFEKGVEKTNSALNDAFGKVAKVIAGISLVRLTQEAFELAEGLEVASARTGIAIENLQRLRFIADQADVGVENITDAINQMQRRIGEENKEFVKAVDAIGLSFDNLQSLAPDQQFLKIAESLAEVDNRAELAARANDIFGRSYTQLLPFITKGSDGIAELSARFDEFGVTLSTQTVGKVDDAGDAFSALLGTVKGLTVELLSGLSPALEASANALNTFLQAIAFGLRNEQGANEIANLTIQIDKLRGQAALFAKDTSDSGKARFRELTAEADRLLLKLNAISGFGLPGLLDAAAVRGPKIDAAALDFAFQNTSFLGTRQETPADRRGAALDAQDRSIGVDVLEANQLELEVNQEHLDALLEQQREHFLARNQIASESAAFRAQVLEFFGLQELSFEQVKSASILDLSLGLFATLARENSKLAKIQQGIALAVATYNIAEGITKALTLPFPQSLIVAAKYALIGATQIASIRSTNYSGSRGGISGAGGGAISARAPEPVTQSAAQEKPQKILQVTVVGNILSGRESANWLLETLRRELEHDVIVVSGNSAQARVIREGV